MKGCTMVGLCRLSSISPQAYYAGKKTRQRRQIDEEVVIKSVRSVRIDHPRMGTRKLLNQIQLQLHEAGVYLGRDRLFEILTNHDMLVKPKRRSVRTTYSDHTLPLYRNLLYDLQPTAPHQVWVSDITCLDTDEGFMYLTLITDLYSRKIVGWNLAANLTAAESVKALIMAIKQTPEDHRPIHHSDRGSLFCCREYVGELHDRDFPISMTEANHCYENCYAERINGILKDEYNLDLRFRTRQQALSATMQAITLYNHDRPHLSLNMATPAHVHSQVEKAA